MYSESPTADAGSGWMRRARLTSMLKRRDTVRRHAPVRRSGTHDDRAAHRIECARRGHPELSQRSNTRPSDSNSAPRFESLAR